MHIQVLILCLLLVSNGKCISHATEVLPSCYRELLKPTKPTNVATKTVFILVNFPWYSDTWYHFSCSVWPGILPLLPFFFFNTVTDLTRPWKGRGCLFLFSSTNPDWSETLYKYKISLYFTLSISAVSSFFHVLYISLWNALWVLFI